MKYRLYDPNYGDTYFSDTALDKIDKNLSFSTIFHLHHEYIRFARIKGLVRMINTGFHEHPVSFYEGDVFWYIKDKVWKAGFVSQLAENCFVLMPHGDNLKCVLDNCMHFCVGNIYESGLMDADHINKPVDRGLCP